jgi:hypothetical protein
LSITISTALGQTGDWSMLSSGLLTAITEVLSKFLYETIKKLSCNLSRFREKRILLILLNFINNLKIGILYGFFLESFKLGS